MGGGRSPGRGPKPSGAPRSAGTAGPVLGVVLAAGGSTRMGRPKQLAELDGRPLLAHVLAAVEAAVAAPCPRAPPPSTPSGSGASCR
jgi:hypothetical protein